MRDPEDAEENRQLEQCAGLPAGFMALGSNDDQPSFEGPNGEVVSGGVMLSTSRARVALAFDALQRPRTIGCIESVMQRSFDDEVASDGDTGIHIGPVTARGLEDGKLGGDTIGFRVEIPFRVEGTAGASFVLTSDLVFVQRGRAVIVVSSISDHVPVPQAFVVDLVGKVGGRLPSSVSS
jgi:hypothetical protein